jgi:Holliday junction DNA helicase RuvB
MGLFENEVDIQEQTLETIKGNEEYREILEAIIGHEERNPGEHEKWSDRPQYDDTAWSVAELPMRLNPGKLGYLKQQNLVESIMQTNNSSIANLWALSDREEIKEALKIDESGEVTSVNHGETTDEDMPDDLFEPIVGHDDIKELFRASVASDEPVHILLVGPPASGKTVFLEEIQRLNDSEFLVGSATSGPGFIDELFEKKPKNILIDEFDKMDKSDYGNLLTLQESGLVKETKGNQKRREMRLEGATVYATANRLDKTPDENLSRFLGDPVIRLEEYDDEQFRQVVQNVLVMREGASEEIAELISEIIAEETGVRDFRECRRIYRLASSNTDNPTAEDVEKYVRIVDDYSASGLL